MINQAFYEGKYVPGNPVTRGCVYCNTWKGKLVFVLIFVISLGIGGYGLLNRYTEYSEAQALLVQEYNLDGLKSGSSENSDASAKSAEEKLQKLEKKFQMEKKRSETMHDEFRIINRKYQQSKETLEQFKATEQKLNAKLKVRIK